MHAHMHTGKKGEVVEEKVEEKVTSIFVPALEAAVQDFVAKWQDRDESANFFQKYDAELVKDELRPIVFEEIRQQVCFRLQATSFAPGLCACSRAIPVCLGLWVGQEAHVPSMPKMPEFLPTLTPTHTWPTPAPRWTRRCACFCRT